LTTCKLLPTSVLKRCRSRFTTCKLLPTLILKRCSSKFTTYKLLASVILKRHWCNFTICKLLVPAILNQPGIYTSSDKDIHFSTSPPSRSEFCNTFQSRPVISSPPNLRLLILYVIIACFPNCRLLTLSFFLSQCFFPILIFRSKLILIQSDSHFSHPLPTDY
jgi:hypothetical protein